MDNPFKINKLLLVKNHGVLNGVTSNFLRPRKVNKVFCTEKLVLNAWFKDFRLNQIKIWYGEFNESYLRLKIPTTQQEFLDLN